MYIYSAPFTLILLSKIQWNNIHCDLILVQMQLFLFKKILLMMLDMHENIQYLWHH